MINEIEEHIEEMELATDDEIAEADNDPVVAQLRKNHLNLQTQIRSVRKDIKELKQMIWAQNGMIKTTRNTVGHIQGRVQKPRWKRLFN